MCGIAVILRNAPARVGPFAIDRMTRALTHRGPDAHATLQLRGCDLGHTRLSIIDQAGGAQPMSDPTGRYHLVFNGEIFNHQTLRQELERAGCRFRTRSDTEVLLHGYIHFGSDVVSRLNGQFAFAIWDSAERQLIAARDRFGEKPLFWAATPAGDILLASEIKSILASGLLEPQLDEDAVDAYLGLYYVPPDQTIYCNVHPMPAGCCATWRGTERRQRRYWQPRLGHLRLDREEAVGEIRRLMDQAIARQKLADVPLGAFLSGGLDSSTIVALLSRQNDRPVKTFAAGFGDLIDELPFAREVARQYHTDHHELQVTIDLAETFEQMLQVYDEPFGDSSNLPTYLLAKYARQQVTVALSGDGGDELFGGYEWYRPRIGCDGGLDAHLCGSTRLYEDRSVLWGGRQPNANLDLDAYHHCEGIDQVCAFDLGCYLPGDILTKVDRAAMAVGLEVRAPFLDVELTEFVLGLPSSLRFERETSKPLLRSAFASLWPSSIRNRAKQGFGAPVRAWLQTPELHALWEQIRRPGGPLVALLPGLPQVVQTLRPQQAWTLLCLGRWLETRSQCLSNLRLAS